MECPGLGQAKGSKKLPTWEQVKPCLLHKLDYEEYYMYNMSMSDRMPAGCNETMKDVPAALAAYGRGLLFPSVENYHMQPRDRNSGCIWLDDPTNTGPERLQPPTKQLVNATWIVSGSMCRFKWDSKKFWGSMDVQQNPENLAKPMGLASAPPFCMFPMSK
jgi:hypothetical protein